jgi:tRNA threonylcarbamoyladenosine biosynthesis protein TsaE
MAPESTRHLFGSLADAERAEATLSEPALAEWAADLGRLAVDRHLFVALYGPLGAGKSTLVRAACRGAGVVGPIPSPTYTLLNEYATPDGRVVSHVDLYRIDAEAELLDLGWEELLARGNAIFVEWAERATGHLPPDRLDIRLVIAPDPDLRSVQATAAGDAPAPPPFEAGC